MQPEQAPSRERRLVVLGVIVLIAICGGVLYGIRRYVAPKPVALVIQTLPAELAAGDEVTFTGPISARNVLPIPAPLEGVIDMIAVEPGASVEQDQPLARIKNDGLAKAHQESKEDLERAAERESILESSLIAARLEASRSAADADRARGDADRLDRAFKREELLYREGATARLKFEKMQKDAAASAAELEALRTAAAQAADKVAKLTADLEALKRVVEEKAKELEGAQSDIDAAMVIAPVDGIIVAVKAKAGDEVSPGANKDLFQIAVAADELQIAIEPEPKVAAKLKDGLPALIQILELSAGGIPGEVKRTGDAWSVAFKAPGAEVKPGLHAIVKVKLP